MIEFDNNNLLKALYGEFEAHLRYLEARLEIEIISRGNQINLSGSQDKIEKAIFVLKQCYERLKKNDEISKADIDGLLRLYSLENDLKSKDQENLEGINIATKKRTLYPRSLTQSLYMEAMEKSQMVFGIGPAGTGKTYLAVAHAAAMLQKGEVDRIILSRPAVEAGEHLGFLPGDMKEKVDPYLRPLYDALYDMIYADKVERALSAGVIEIAPLAFMRGRTLERSAVILDEAQNTTPMQMKMFLTRLGEGSKMFITGDPSQIDLPQKQKSGLNDAIAILHDIKNIKIIKFTDKDVVRHPLVARIVKAYDEAQ